MSDNSQYPTPEELTQRRSSGAEKRLATSALERTRTGLRTASSGLLALLAKRTGRSVDEIAEDIPEDTIRRTKYPVAITENDDGTLSFNHITVVPGKELQHAPTTPGSKRDSFRGGVDVKRT